MSSPFGELLAAERERRGWSQSHLAFVTGLQPSAISHFETGRREPSLANFRRLVVALQCKAGHLLGTEWTAGDFAAAGGAGAKANG